MLAGLKEVVVYLLLKRPSWDLTILDNYHPVFNLIWDLVGMQQGKG